MLDEQLGKTQFLAGDAFSYGDIPVGIMVWRYRELAPERQGFKNARPLVRRDRGTAAASSSTWPRFR